MSPGAKFRDALTAEQPLQLPGVINAYAAILARDAGFRALYLSGAGVANASFGLPDLGVTTLDHVLEDTRRIAAATDLPLLVDADTGWDDPGHAVAELERAGAAGCHLEDQVPAKRCGHRPNKQLVSTGEMTGRIRAACGGRADPSFVVMARTDAVAPEGLAAAIARCRAYVEAGADMIFSEALTSLDDYRAFTSALDVPVLANITEFGKTPLFTLEELDSAGIGIALYPLSAFRAMSKAALDVLGTLRSEGTQKASLGDMQTRDQLYEHLNYHRQETELDQSS
ncbi:methylisocitrate lyase [Verrucomicrobiales bacterium]|nr:methylisocitrate lyase [Verrucomicrobiales bacterium]